MKNERILNALERADDRYVEEAAPVKAIKTAEIEENAVRAEPVTVNAPKRKIYGGRIAAAACACVAVGGLVVWGAVGGVGKLTENPSTADTEEYAQTNSPESNGYHNFTMTREELYDCVWSCFIPTYFPAGYSFSGDAQCTTANGTVPTDIEANISFWLSNGVNDPDTVGYNPIYFGLTIRDVGIVESSPVYELQALTVGDIAEMGKGGLINCGHDVRLQIGYPNPEQVPDEEIYKMIMSMPYAWQYQNDPSDKTGYSVAYLTAEQIRSAEGMPDYIPTKLPAGYNIVGLSPHYTFNGPDNHGNTLTLYISNGVEDPYSTNYNPIKYTVMITPENSALDTESKPLYQNIWTLTLDDVKAAMESGGFYVVYMGNEVTEVSFPYPDRISAQEIYDMVMSAPCAVDPNAENVGYQTVYLSREELYTNQWTMFIPRYMPGKYHLADNTRFDVDEFREGTIYAEFTDGNNPISYTVYIDAMEYPNLGNDSALVMRDITVGDMPALKENGWIDSGNSVVKIKVDIEKPELISDEELYRFIMSAPYSDNFAASGIETVDLSEYVDADVPTVAFDQFYNVERVEIRTKFNVNDTFLPFFDVDMYGGLGLDGEFGDIVGYDGRNVYFEAAGYVESEDSNGQKITLTVRIIGMYDTAKDSYRQLVRYYENDLEFIYADGEFIYYIVRETEGDKVLHSTFCKRSINDTTFEAAADGSLLTVDGNISNPVVNGSCIYYAVDSEGQYGIVRFDMNEDVEAAISANKLFVSMTAVPEAVEAVTPYKEGVAYNLQSDTKRWYYWNGEETGGMIGEAVFLFKAETDTDVYSDGKIFYTVTDGKLFNGTDYDNKQCFDALDIMGLTVTDREYLAANNGVESNPWYTFSEARNMANADGMIVPASYTGIIYDEQNGWFTHVDPDKNYWSRPCAGDYLLMLEEDEEYGLSVTGDVYDDYLTLCIITRK